METYYLYYARCGSDIDNVVNDHGDIEMYRIVILDNMVIDYGDIEMYSIVIFDNEWYVILY